MGLLAAFLVLRTRTALVTGDVVVAATVDVVTAGVVVASGHGNPSHGHPAGQFS